MDTPLVDFESERLHALSPEEVRAIAETVNKVETEYRFRARIVLLQALLNEFREMYGQEGVAVLMSSVEQYSTQQESMKH